MSRRNCEAEAIADGIHESRPPRPRCQYHHKSIFPCHPSCPASERQGMAKGAGTCRDVQGHPHVTFDSSLEMCLFVLAFVHCAICVCVPSSKVDGASQLIPTGKIEFKLIISEWKNISCSTSSQIMCALCDTVLFAIFKLALVDSTVRHGQCPLTIQSRLGRLQANHTAARWSISVVSN